MRNYSQKMNRSKTNYVTDGRKCSSVFLLYIFYISNTLILNKNPIFPKINEL